MEKPETNLATTSAAEDRSPPHLRSQPQTPPPGGSSLARPEAFAAGGLGLGAALRRVEAAAERAEGIEAQAAGHPE